MASTSARRRRRRRPHEGLPHRLVRIRRLEHRPRLPGARRGARDAPPRRHRPDRSRPGEAQRRRHPSGGDRPLGDLERPGRDAARPRARLGQLRGSHPQCRRCRQRDRGSGAARLDGLGLRRHAGALPRDDPTKPDQLLWLPEGAVGAGRESARGARHCCADRGRSGRALGPAAGAAVAGCGLRLLRRIAGRRAATRRALHGLGRPAAEHARHADARERRCRADVACACAPGRRHPSLRRRRACRPDRAGAARGHGLRSRSGSARHRSAGCRPASGRRRAVRHATRCGCDRRSARGRAAGPRHDASPAAQPARELLEPRVSERYDLITMGRVGVDIYPQQIGVSLADVTSFSKFLGGTATNVAVAAARLGARAAVITKVGDDPFGPYVRRALEGFGVDAGFVGTHPTLRTPVVFCEIHPPDDFPLLFYREPTAPDMTIEPDELDLAAIRDARVFWTTGTGLSAEPSRASTLAALSARSEAADGAITVHDLDWRPMFWAHPEQAGALQREALAHATVAVGNRDEVEVAVGTRDPLEASARLLDLGLDIAIVKQGPPGVLARTRDGVVEVPPIRLEVVNGLGAGDAFGGALVHALLNGWEVEHAVRLAKAAGAYVASQLACADAMPSMAELAPLVGDTAGADAPAAQARA